MTPRFSRDYLHHNSIIRLLIACGAAGAALAASESDAAIVWSGDSNVQISYGFPVNLDLDSDSNNEYIFDYFALYPNHLGATFWGFWVTSGEPGAAWAVPDGGGDVLNLPSGVAVDSNLTFSGDSSTNSLASSDSDGGNWLGAGTSGFMGLSFDISGQTHYGWASLRNGGGYSSESLYLTGWAYETEPGVGIQTGVIPTIVPEQAGDFDGDNDIDGGDFLDWQRNFGLTSGATKAQGDADNNGTVDGNDLAIWQATYGQSWEGSLSANVTVPEPASVLLVLLGFLGAAGRRR